MRVLSRLFRGLILKGLKQAHADGRLQFFNDHAALADRATFNAYLKPLYKTNWSVFAKEPFAGPKAVLAYLSRYTHRVAISNRRLINADDKKGHLLLEGLSGRRRRTLQDDGPTNP